MKRLVTTVSLLAIVNLLGMAGAIGWLFATQRLTPERVEAVRAILHEPAPVEQARLEAEAAAAEVREETVDPLDEIDLPGGPPVGAESRVSIEQERDRAGEFRGQRLDREIALLAQTQKLVFQQLDQERQDFEAERDRFERRQAEIATLRGDAQFQAAISVLTQVKAAAAKEMLQEIIEGRVGSLAVDDAPGMTGIDRAVAYLNELDEMVRGKIMAEFVKDSPMVAAELLERLRTFGLMAEATGAEPP